MLVEAASERVAEEEWLVVERFIELIILMFKK